MSNRNHLRRSAIDSLPSFPSTDPKKTTESICLDAQLHSFRSSFVDQLLREEFLNLILKDRAILLCAILEPMLGAWLEVVAQSDFYSQIEKGDILWTDNNEKLWKIVERHQFSRQNLDMLRKSFAVIRHKGISSLRAQRSSSAYRGFTNLETDFGDLITQTEQQLEGMQQRIVALAALRSIAESERAIEQSNKLGWDLPPNNSVRDFLTNPDTSTAP